jgi:hypothetical protein
LLSLAIEKDLDWDELEVLEKAKSEVKQNARDAKHSAR